MVKKYLPCLLLLCAAPVFAKPTLTVYTYDSFAADWGPGPAVKKAFEAECDCELKFVALEDGVSLLNRLRMEGKNSKADVVLGLDNNLLEAASQSKLFAKSGVPASAVSVPGGWDNDTFVPFDYGYFAFVYDKNKLKNPPKSLKELVEGEQKWRVIYEDPRTSTPGLGLLLWMPLFVLLVALILRIVALDSSLVGWHHGGFKPGHPFEIHLHDLVGQRDGN